MDNFNTFVDKIIPIKYHKVVYIGILFLFIGSFITTCAYKRNTTDNEVAKELKCLNDNYKVIEARIGNIENRIDNIENNMTNLSLKISDIDTKLINSNINYYNSLSKGFELTRQEMVKAHPTRTSAINTRYDDYFAYLHILIPNTPNK